MQRDKEEDSSQAQLELSALESMIKERGVPLAEASETPLKSSHQGSYATYYDRRKNDPRMSLLRKESHRFRGARVLDIGCNSGCLSAAIAKEFGVRSLLGVDIDQALVDAANREHRTDREGQQVTFRVSDWGDPSAEPALDLSEGPERLDVIMCFSVTKWIHLNHGDAGLLHLFRRAHECLAPGGILTLEPQPLKSYYKVYCLSETTKQKFAQIQLWPESFPAFLTSGALRPGFQVLAQHSPTGASGSSQRHIWIFQKKCEA